MDYLINVAKNREFESLEKLIDLEEDDYKKSMILSIILETVLKMKEYDFAIRLFKKINKEPYKSIAIDIFVENVKVEDKEKLREMLKSNDMEGVRKMLEK